MSTADPARPDDPLPEPLLRAVGLLTCPVCGSTELTAPARRDRVAGLDCPAGHHWDAARQGVVNLLTGAGSRFTPDTPAMVEARDRFLRGGHFTPIAAAVATAVRSAVTTDAPAVLDAGAGTGYYLDAVLAAFADGSPATGDTTPDGPAAVATDLSPAALRHLARAVPTALPLVWDTWRPLPLRDGAVDVVLAVFAPRNGPEFARVLAPGGVLVLVTPRPGHLARLREATGMLAVDPDKDDRLQRSLADQFTVLARHDVDVPLDLTGAEAVDAAFMGPAGHHATAAELAARLGAVGAPLRVDAQVTVQVLRPRARGGDAG